MDPTIVAALVVLALVSVFCIVAMSIFAWVITTAIRLWLETAVPAESVECGD